MKTLILTLSILGVILLVAILWIILIMIFCLLVPVLKDLANINYTEDYDE